METVLPSKKIHKTPRIVVADAYTVGSDKFQSAEAREQSTYYVTFRRKLHNVDPFLYEKSDDRILFCGLQRILEKLFYEPVTHAEIDEAKRFLSTFKVTTKGLAPYEFPEHLWRRIVDEFNGRPPIQIKALPEGSVVYPNEPVIQIRSLVEGFGELAAWFESKILQTWAASERLTQSMHWFKKLKQMVRSIDPYLSDAEVEFHASLMLADFGDRAGITAEESEELGLVHLYVFPGTDTCAGAYQAWKNANETPVGCSVNALAHRNIQAYKVESNCYSTIYESCNNNEIISMVADCYDFFHATEFYLLPLALRSKKEQNGKVVVARPDSGDPKEQVLFTCRLAEKNGLVEYRNINGKTWKFATFFKFIEADGMDFQTMWEIMEALIAEGFVPYSFGLFGVGGGLRNYLKRDNLSAKYALAAMGKKNDPVVKFSETLGKTTLPGPFKLLRTKEAILNCKTICFEHDPGDDYLVEYFNGLNIYKPFSEGQDDDFLQIKERIHKQFASMPESLDDGVNLGYPASIAILDTRRELLKKYAPNKNSSNY